MSTTMENMHHHADATGEHVVKKEQHINETNVSGGSVVSSSHLSSSTTHGSSAANGSDKHPLHQYDLSLMTKLYEACMNKASEEGLVAKSWRPLEWASERHERKHDWSTPVVVSHKQRVYECFERLAKESGEPMILMPAFDLGDVVNFERFLDALKVDGINAIGRYKQYLNSRDMRKFEVDLVVIHPVHGILLVETKESDMFDNKKRSRVRMHLNAARQSFEAILRLILEAHGLKPSDAQLPVYQFVALPNVREMPARAQQTRSATDANNAAAANTSSSSIGSATAGTRPNRSLNYLIKSDLEEHSEFVKWWHRCVEEPTRLLAEAKREEEEREREKEREREEKDENEKEKREKEAKKEKKMVSKRDLINQMMGLMACIRNNSILPVVYPELDMMESMGDLCRSPSPSSEEHHHENKDEKEESNKQQHLNQPAMKIYAEFLHPEHEKARSLSRCVVLSKDSEKIRRTICLQAMWLLLNDSQKKISVVTSEANKPYYEEFFARQRKVYNNLNNLRFYVDIHSCDPSQHTLRRDGEIWFFDSGVTMKSDAGVTLASLNDILTRVRDLQSYWIFTENHDQVNQHSQELESLALKHVRLDYSSHYEHNHHHHQQSESGLVSVNRIKLPLRLHCDLLIVGDLIGLAQLKYLYKHLKSSSVLNQAHAYRENAHQHHHQQQHMQYQQLKFNPSKKFRTVKFIRGGTIENLRNALKMHDSIQAPVIFMHVGDEDLFKNRQSMTTIERVKELATLMREYCPKSFVVLSTLMRRQSRTENGVISEVNKGITSFCKQTKDSMNTFYMLNNHFEPDFHTQGGRLLTPKGLKLFADNMLFTVDHFFIRNNKQH